MEKHIIKHIIIIIMDYEFDFVFFWKLSYI